MPQRRLDTVDVRMLILRLRSSSSDRQVSKDVGVARETVRRYREWAQRHGVLEGELLPLSSLNRLLDETLPKLNPPQNSSTVEPYRDLVLQLRREGVEVRAAYCRIKERGYRGSYSSVYRFVQALEKNGAGRTKPEDEVVVRVETLPGDEAQVDFGYAGWMFDPVKGRPRKAWAFVMTLSYSRHQYAEFVFDQSVGTWLGLHVRAFAYFGGCPGRVRPDNLKAAVIKACWNDPVVNRSYGECAEHYGFLISPCRPRTPEHKGKVESGVHFLKRNFLAGRGTLEANALEANALEANALEANSVLPHTVHGKVQGKVVLDFERANREVREWCLEEAGKRCHGTTKEQPLERFVSVERACLKPLPLHTYDPGDFRRVKLHRDCHVVFDNSFYSAPFGLVGQMLLVRGGLTTVRIYDSEHILVATHERSTQPGTRTFLTDHLPPHKVPALLQTRDSCLEEAALVGPNTLEVVQVMLSDPIRDRLESVGRLVRLKDKYGVVRLEDACRRACSFHEHEYKTVKGILETGADITDWPRTTMTSEEISEAARKEACGTTAPFLFVRSDEELLGHLFASDQHAADFEDEGSSPWL